MDRYGIMGVHEPRMEKIGEKGDVFWFELREAIAGCESGEHTTFLKVYI